MKKNIVVSHSQKQHVYRLVYGLIKYGNLKKFFTSMFFAENSLLKKLVILNSKTEKLLKKRSFSKINKQHVTLTIFPEIIFQILKKIKHPSSLYYLDRLHDIIVSYLLRFHKFDFIVGYEGQCLKSFKYAKSKGKITILDLASIHAKKQRQINSQYNNILTGLKSSYLLKQIKPIKEAELECTDYIITLSDFAKKSCIDAGIHPDKIFTVQLGMDIETFTPKELYNTDKFEILIVSAMRYSKGIKDLIESFIDLNLPNSQLTLVGGEGDAINYVQSSLLDNIIYHPYMVHSELRTLYQRASIFILPSYMDSWGQVVCEAMACGTPVIISENTGAKDVINDGVNGFVVGVANQFQLAEKIIYFYNDRSEVERMGKNARKSVEHLTWENYYLQVNEIMKKIGSETEC